MQKKKLFYFTVNLGTVDTSGLPTYSYAFIDFFKEKYELVVFNIIAGESETRNKDSSYRQYDLTYLKLFTEYSDEVKSIVKRTIDSENPDIVIVQDHIFSQYVADFKDERSFKFIFFLHLCQRGLLNAMTKASFFKETLNSCVYLLDRSFEENMGISIADAVISNSEFSTRELVKYYPEASGNILSAPLGVNIASYPYAPVFDKCTWAYFGRLDSQKGVHFLLRDFKLFFDDYRKNPIIVAGAGAVENAFFKAFLKDGVVDYRGELKKPELIEMLKEVKYCIFPSIYEPYGLALNEALAMGKICIVNAVDSGMLEQLRFGEDINGFIIDFEKQSPIKTIEYLESQPRELLERVAANARKFANSEKDHFSKLEEFLKTL